MSTFYAYADFPVPAPPQQAATPTNCAACGEANDPSSLFCRRCTSPISVVNLDQLTAEDHYAALYSLLAVLAESLQPPGLEKLAESGSAVPLDRTWGRYLSAFWLRPETALLCYAEAQALAQLKPDPQEPWLDLGCGDGIHCALYSDWEFDPGFDAFQSLDLHAKDIYNCWDPGHFHVSVLRKGCRRQWGIDIKPTAIERARALGVFDRVIQADVTQLPLPDRCVQTIFSNMLRDLGEPLPAALHECRRILRDDGLLLISAMTPDYADNLFYAPAARQALAQGDRVRAEQYRRLDRGRSVFCQRQLTADQWEELLRPAGLRLCTITTIAGSQAVRFWDTGFRPFSALLLQQRQIWRSLGVLPAVKEQVVSLLDHVLKPLAQQLHAGPACMHLLAVRKR